MRDFENEIYHHGLQTDGSTVATGIPKVRYGEDYSYSTAKNIPHNGILILPFFRTPLME